MLRTFGRIAPRIHASAFVHDSAEVIGRVTLAAGVSIWPMCVLRGDVDRITVGERTNIQDLTVVHSDHGVPTIIGKGVTVGHSAVLHGCRIEDGCLIGMGATVLECRVGRESLIGAGAMVPARLRIPPRSLVLGLPAKVIRPLTPEELARLRRSADIYSRLAKQHKSGSRVVFS
ncbi:MAG: gamma carbonic anhydrase family protein [Elusimicrobiota bacterium]|jgi:carbonic anhydrase/acetyltransferase-like protein (isoleucine patch superfamily)